MKKVLIQMELLKLIKNSMFEVSFLNEIVDGMIERMNISGADFMNFTVGVWNRPGTINNRLPKS